MIQTGAVAIDLGELARRVRRADPDALMVAPRVLRRVIRADRGLRLAGWSVNHRPHYAIRGAALRAIVAGDGVGLRPGEPWPATALLLARPDPDDLAGTTWDALLTDTWRQVFQARIQADLAAARAAGRLDDAAIRARVGAIGPVAFEEARAVLRQDGRLLPPRDDFTAYAEFAAAYLDLRHFAPGLLPHAFPAVDDPEAVDAALAADLDAAATRAATRPEGAAEPAAAAAPEEDEDDVDDDGPAGAAGEGDGAGPDVPRKAYIALMRKARRAEGQGNVVRAAILRARASHRASPRLSGRAVDAARQALDALAERLGAALGEPPPGVEAWARALPALLGRAALGFWSAEARVLYDLQKACLDHERQVYAVDLVEWALTRGRRPIRRPLPNLREVMTSRHLRDASRRLRSARLDPAARRRLAGLLTPAVHRAELALRRRFRPAIAGVLDETGVVAADLPEEVARARMVEEMLDRLVSRGFLTMPDVRDAMSRGDLKLPDLAGPMGLIRGDRLLRTDRALDVALDGVYHRGEAYLRGLQRMTSAAFGTRVGRFLVRYVALPYGGAYVALEGLQHIVELLGEHVVHAPLHLVDHRENPWPLLILGTVTMGLIDIPEFRRRFFRALRWAGRTLSAPVVDWPAWVLRRELVRRVLDGRAAALAWRFGVKPLAVAAPAGLAALAAGRGPREAATAAGAAFAVAFVALNVRMGRDAEEIVADALGRAWRRAIFDWIPGLFHLIMSAFDRMLEGVERVLYAVDEWLRFRSGQGRLSLWGKAVLGLGWSAVAYLVRFCVVLLIEPQLNPIKHFPVVTVSHKIILPYVVPNLGALLFTAGYPKDAAYTMALVVAGLIPGIFGFLVWELKENWRLYAANRPRTLQPVAIGHHGETMARLLRPGFHSGTIPKRFARIRAAERRELRTGHGRTARRHREALHHDEEQVRHFFERGLIALLERSPTLGPVGVRLGEVELATNRVVAVLESADPSAGPLRLSFEERSGWLVAGVDEPGWLPRLSDARRRALATALAGLYTMAGVDLVREQLCAALGASEPRYEFAPSGVLVYPDDLSAPAALLDLRDPARPAASPSPGRARRAGFDARSLLFGRLAVTWRRWVETWEGDRNGTGHPSRFIEGLRLLPGPGSGRRKVRKATGRRRGPGASPVH